jgi:hypothetical protein
MQLLANIPESRFSSRELPGGEFLLEDFPGPAWVARAVYFPLVLQRL